MSELSWREITLCDSRPWDKVSYTKRPLTQLDLASRWWKSFDVEVKFAWM